MYLWRSKKNIMWIPPLIWSYELPYYFTMKACFVLLMELFWQDNFILHLNDLKKIDKVIIISGNMLSLCTIWAQLFKASLA